MDEKQLTALFNAGLLTSVVLVLNPMGKGFLLQFTAKDNKTYTLSSFRVDARVFKTYDLAAKVAKSIGFKTMTIIL